MAVITCAVPVLVVAQALYAAPLYNFATLDDPLGTGGTAATAISGNYIVGTYFDSVGTAHGFGLTGSTYTTLDDPLASTGAGSGTVVKGVSGNTVVGYYTDSNGNENGFVYNGSDYTTFDYPSATQTVITGLSGTTIIGYYFSGTAEHGFIYNGLTFQTLDDPSAVYATQPLGISNNTIVGYFNDSDATNHGFMYQGTAFTTLDDPAGGETVASAISGSTIVGYYGFPVTLDSNHGFVFNGSSYVTLDDPSGIGNTFPEGVSSTGTIVGFYYDSGDIEEGFVATIIPEPSMLAWAMFGAFSLLRSPFLTNQIKWCRYAKDAKVST